MIKQGDLIQNYQGRWAKVVTIKGQHYGLSAFVGKKEDAEKETVATRFLNSFGMSQILPAKEDGEGDGNEPKTVNDLTVKELQALATAYGLETSGKKPDLVARIETHLQAEVDGMIEHTVTDDDLKTYPVLAEMGVQVGATIYLPAKEDGEGDGD